MRDWEADAWKECTCMPTSTEQHVPRWDVTRIDPLVSLTLKKLGLMWLALIRLRALLSSWTLWCTAATLLIAAGFFLVPVMTARLLPTLLLLRGDGTLMPAQASSLCLLKRAEGLALTR